MTAHEADGLSPRSGHEPPLTIPEAAKFLNVTDRWVIRAIRERRLPYLKVGRQVRFLVADLRDYLVSTRVAARTDGPTHLVGGSRAEPAGRPAAHRPQRPGPATRAS